ncbi:MAG: hypothetical protein WC302_03340 [Candidatus Paceibacterota bacterium]|jgi:hypothetical protein
MKESASICIHEGNMMEGIWISTDTRTDRLILDVAEGIEQFCYEGSRDIVELPSAIFLALVSHRHVADDSSIIPAFGISLSLLSGDSHCTIYVNTLEREVEFGVQRFSFGEVVECPYETLLKLYRIEDVGEDEASGSEV